MRNLQQSILIRTPEGVSFPLLLASPMSRFLAVFIDILCVQFVMSVLQMAVQLMGIISTDLAYALYAILSFIVQLAYPIVLEWYWKGQTVGKRILRLQVMDTQGLKLQFSQVAVRNLLRLIDMLPMFYMVGGLTVLLSSKRQRLGDMAGNTIVVRHPKIVEPDIDQVIPDKYNSFRECAQYCAQLKRNSTPREAGIALQAIMRREDFDPEERLQLFATLRSHFEKKARLPQEITDGLSDEKYLRNVVDILFRI
jgi:uncharacterized RDD family membrane protein YckC